MEADCEAEFDFIVIGGGIAGISCAEVLSTFAPKSRIAVLSLSRIFKVARNYTRVTKLLDDFDVVETGSEDWSKQFSNVNTIICRVERIDPKNKVIAVTTISDVPTSTSTSAGVSSCRKYFRYRHNVCVCCGARPKLFIPDEEAARKRVLGIRDTHTVDILRSHLEAERTRRMLVVGNGGIATELVFALRSADRIELVWAIRDSSISSVFFDVGAAEFLLDLLLHSKNLEHNDRSVDNTTEQDFININPERYRTKYLASSVPSEAGLGASLGPSWAVNLAIPVTPADESQSKQPRSLENAKLTIEYNCEVRRVWTREEYLKDNQKSTVDSDSDWPVFVELTNGKHVGVDVIISATGVQPIVDCMSAEDGFEFGPDGGAVIDEYMRTSCASVFAAGDCAYAGWTRALNWIQLRLWTQARSMGAYAARCMLADAEDRLSDTLPDFSFELFAHVTRFFGKKVVLLGRYNAQQLDREQYHVLLRVTRGDEYVKCVVGQDGRICGAVLIGETELEETLENLILNQIDVTPFGVDLLDPAIDIGDYFD